MSNIFYQHYRIEIRPTPMPGGWSAQVHIWSFQGGTTHMTALSLPTHIPFGTEASVRAYAEKVARRWVEQQSASQPPYEPEAGAHPHAGTPTYSLERFSVPCDLW